MSIVAASAVADQLYRLAEDLSEEPFAGSGKCFTELGEQFARRAVEVLHSFLVLHPELDSHGTWSEIKDGSSTWEVWQGGGW